MTDLARFGRLLWPGRNELCRGSDRVEYRARLAALLLALLWLPVAAAIGSQSYADLMDLAERQRVELHQETATLTEDAARSPSTGRGGFATGPVAVHATWATGTGTVTAAYGTPAGSTVAVWVDRTGAPAVAPTTEADAVGGAVAVAICLWLSVLGLLGMLLVTLAAVLNRRRAEAWQREWQRVEPQWRHRTR